ncbi:unnamed protein product [Hydatigera taeniaeformis]|uniref:Secreted protein n=1 Tax=Hydatigena taeniaeformis TaxID=6205 RepID=A0A0R3WTK4_HYDTA|nr:unnamed protein product [Hydatigera taeniaeformis]
MPILVFSLVATGGQTLEQSEQQAIEVGPSLDQSDDGKVSPIKSDAGLESTGAFVEPGMDDQAANEPSKHEKEEGENFGNTLQLLAFVSTRSFKSASDLDHFFMNPPVAQDGLTVCMVEIYRLSDL